MKLDDVEILKNEDGTLDIVSDIAGRKICFRKCRIRFSNSDLYKMEYNPNHQQPVVKQDEIHLDMHLIVDGKVIYADSRDKVIAAEKEAAKEVKEEVVNNG